MTVYSWERQMVNMISGLFQTSNGSQFYTVSMRQLRDATGPCIKNCEFHERSQIACRLKIRENSPTPTYHTLWI